MSAPLPNALRERFQRLSEEGLSGRAAASRLKLSPATGARWGLAIRQVGQARTAHRSQPKAKFDEVLELSLQFLANPWKLWESGHITLRSTVLRLAFAERLQYHRKTGARTPKIAFVFNALGGHLGGEVKSGAVGETRTLTGVTPQRPQRCASTIPPRPQAMVCAGFSGECPPCEEQKVTKNPRCFSATGAVVKPCQMSAYSLTENVGKPVLDAACGCGKLGKAGAPFMRWEATRISSVRSG